MSAGGTGNHPVEVQGTAVCCSGGGIRSASYCLGALEALAADPAAPDLTVVTAVSGGSYVAAAGALAEPARRPGAERGAATRTAAGHSQERTTYLSQFRPGSAIETRLREHTHYLLPDAVSGVQGLLALLWGAIGNMLLVGSLIFVVCALDGWLLAAIGGMTWTKEVPNAAITAVQVWVPAGLGLAAAVTFVFGRLTEQPPGGAGPLWAQRWQRLTAVLLALAAAATVLLVAVPCLFAAVWHVAGGPPSTSTSVRTSAVALSVLAGGATAFAKAAAGTISAAWRRLGPAQGVTRPWILRAGSAAIPWLGSAFVVLMLAALCVYVTGTATAPGYQHVTIAVAAIAFAGLHVLMDVNRSSMHDFYAGRLASAFADQTRAGTRMSELAIGTDLVICAAANLRGGERRQHRRQTVRGVPPGRGAVSCVFTPHRTELHFPGPDGRTESALTRTYEDLIRPDRMTVFDVTAVSGAAVAPLMGKLTSAAHRLLFGAVNLRLGVWLPRPSLVGLLDGRTATRPPADRAAWRRRLIAERIAAGPHASMLARQLAAWDAIRYHHQCAAGHSRWRPGCITHNLMWRFWQPNLLLLWREVAGTNPESATWVYLTDGGHYDNLGLVEALRHRPARILVIDASGDQEHTYATLGQAIALARSELGVEISIEPADMELPAAGPARQPVMIAGRPTDVVRPFATGAYRYTRDSCAGQAGQLDIVKLGVWDGHDLPWDVRAYFARHPTFPRDSTLKQLYDDEDFEAYRELGQASMQALLDYRKAWPAGTPILTQG